jgi:hypothetical protein
VFRFSLQLLSEIIFFLRRTERDMIKNVYWRSCTSPRYSCIILIKLEFSRQFFEKILQNQISWKCVQWGPSRCIRTGGRTAMLRTHLKIYLAPTGIRNSYGPARKSRHYIDDAIRVRRRSGTEKNLCPWWEPNLDFRLISQHRLPYVSLRLLILWLLVCF